MFLLYDLIFLIFGILSLPLYLVRGKFHRGFLRRLGVLPPDLILERPIWIHAVSVGEAVAVRGLVEELRKIYPREKFVISTVTATGNKIARDIAEENDFVTYLPLDLSFIVRKVISRINPLLFIIAETEIWPNLITWLSKKNIPVITVNGRISDASFKGYSLIKFLLKPILGKVDLFCVQAEQDAERLIYLGVKPVKIEITGNMKFDATEYAPKKDFPDYREELGLKAKDKLLVAGSTHRGEEEIILSVYRSLQARFADLNLLIAPRHPQRAGRVANLIRRKGFTPRKISLLNETAKQRNNETTVFILDSIGQLASCYRAADIVFIGGSLVKKGGHNILEPAAQDKPILFGPYMFNFSDITELYLAHKAALMVNNQEELACAIAGLLNDTLEARRLGQEARQLLRANQGATKRNAEYIRQRIINHGD